MKKTVRHWWKKSKMTWTDTPCSWTVGINIVKMTILPKAIYRFNANPVKLHIAFFTELEQKFLQFVWKHKSPQIAKVILRRKKKTNKQSWKNQALWLQTILQSYSNQDSMGLAQKKKKKNRNTDQWNSMVSPEINPCTYGHLIFDKGGKNIHWRTDSLFNKCCWENWTATCKIMKLEYFLTSLCSCFRRETSVRSPGGEHGNPLQYSCWRIPMDRGAWQTTVHGGSKELDTTEWLSTAQHKELNSVLCDDLEGLDGGKVGGRLKREGIYIYIYIHTHTYTHTYLQLSHVVQQKLTTLWSNYVPIEK